MAEAIRIEGLAKFQRDLKKLDADLPKALRIAFNDAADSIVTDTRAHFPSRSGRARGTVKAKSTRTKARVSEGGNRAPYVPWLDFGGSVGRRRSVHRAFLDEGRYLYAGYYRKRDSGEFADSLTQALLKVAAQAGIEVE